MVNAIILAGDRKGSLAEGVANKALIRINSRYMIEYVIDALKSSPSVDRIVVVGPESLRGELEAMVDAVLGSEGSILENMKRGIEYFDDSRYVVVCTSDIPMVSGEAIENFIHQCTGRGVDIGYPIIEKSLNDLKYPEVKRTYVRMKDGTYTGGNIVYVNPDAMKKCYPMAEELVENRKNAIKLGRAFGIWTLIKLSLGILKIKSVEKRVYKLFGINARAIETSYPEIGNDVDKAADVDFVNKYMNKSA